MMHEKKNLFHKTSLDYIFSFLNNNNITCYLLFCIHYFLCSFIIIFHTLSVKLSFVQFNEVNISCTNYNATSKIGGVVWPYQT